MAKLVAGLPRVKLPLWATAVKGQGNALDLGTGPVQHSVGRVRCTC